MEVKGHQRSNVVNYVLWLPNLVRRIPDASLWWRWPSWRSKVIRGQMRKLCAMATKLSHKKPWCKFMMMTTFMKVKGHQRLNVVNVALWLSNLVRKNPWCKFMMVMTFMKVRGHQRSNVVNFALWLPNLVSRIANVSCKQWWPSRLRHFNECFCLTSLVPLQRAQSCLVSSSFFLSDNLLLLLH